MDPVTTEFAYVVARWALTVVFTWLVKGHVMTSEQGETFVTAFAHNAVLALPAIGALVLGICAKIRARRKLMIATSAANMTENEVKAILKNSASVPTISTPPNTVPGVPK